MNLIKTNSFELATYARGDKSSPKLALVLPGMLDTKDYPHMTSHVDFLSKKGFYAVSFDPPATWESPGDISLYNITNYIKTVEELIEYYGNRPTVTIGHSRGGSVAILSGIKNKCVTHFISIMGSYAPGRGVKKENLRQPKESFRDTPPADRENKVRFLLPPLFFQDALKYNALEYLKKCKKPKMFFYGEHDDLVSPRVVREAFNASSEPKEIHSLDSNMIIDIDQRLFQK